MQVGQTRMPDDVEGPAASEWRRGASFNENGSSTVSQYCDEDGFGADGLAPDEEEGCGKR